MAAADAGTHRRRRAAAGGAAGAAHEPAAAVVHAPRRRRVGVVLTMKERPILFSGAMVRALLAGTKTQTRRVVKFRRGDQIEERDDGALWPWMYDEGNDSDSWLRCPYGRAGDRLGVRGTWASQVQAQAAPRDEDSPLVYAADGQQAHQMRLCDRWRSPIHMPRDRKSTRLNSSHHSISYAVFCL